MGASTIGVTVALQYVDDTSHGWGDSVRTTNRLCLFAIISVALVALAAAPSAAKQPPPQPTDPGGVYLSLGDSLAFGFQGRILDKQLSHGDDVDPSAYDNGYSDVLA